MKNPTPQVSFSLFCGANIGTDGRTVSAEDFAGFLRVHVTPRFPGFTVRTAEGYWQGEPETVREIVLIVDDTERANIQAIARSYCGRFSQDCVLVTETAVSVVFETSAQAKPETVR